MCERAQKLGGGGFYVEGASGDNSTCQCGFTLQGLSIKSTAYSAEKTEPGRQRISD